MASISTGFPRALRVNSSILDRRALRLNLEAFKRRLREIGFYEDLSDAFVTQKVSPRYAIERSAGTEKNGRARMSNAFTRLSQDKLNATVAGLLCPRIEAILADRGPGHCMRVTDLDDAVMESVCKELRRTRPDGNIFVLGSHGQEGMPFRVTSTKLVELRNPDANGELRQPLLVFIPTSLRTSAEDSFGVATFEELAFTAIYEDLTSSLLDRLPATLVGHVRDLFGIICGRRVVFLPMTFPAFGICSRRWKMASMGKRSEPACMN
jgi:hypothetical protein